MNEGSLNTYTFASAPYEPIVRAFVVGFCRALIATQSHTQYKLHMTLEAESRLSGAIGRAFTRNILEAACQAQIDGPLGHTEGRLVVDATGQAEIVHNLYAIRLRADAEAQALVSVEGRVYARNPVFTVAEADVHLGEYMVRVRAPVSLEALANLDVDGVVFPRRYVTSPTPVFGVSIVAVVPRALRRAPVQSEPQAQIDGVLSRALARLAVSSQAQAEIEINLNQGVIRRIPWDEPAPEDRQFLVAPEQTIFPVVA